MSGVTQKTGQGGEMEVDGDSFSINRFAQGLVGDFLGKVLGPSRTRSNLVDKSAALGHEACCSTGWFCVWFMCYPGVVHKPMTVQDELTRSWCAPNEWVLFRTHLCLEKKVWGTSLVYDPTLPHTTPPSSLCAISEESHWVNIRDFNTQARARADRVCYLSPIPCSIPTDWG